jgi:hypothetical protein
MPSARQMGMKPHYWLGSWDAAMRLATVSLRSEGSIPWRMWATRMNPHWSSYSNVELRSWPPRLRSQSYSKNVSEDMSVGGKTVDLSVACSRRSKFPIPKPSVLSPGYKIGTRIGPSQQNLGETDSVRILQQVITSHP